MQFKVTEIMVRLLTSLNRRRKKRGNEIILYAKLFCYICARNIQLQELIRDDRFLQLLHIPNKCKTDRKNIEQYILLLTNR